MVMAMKDGLHLADANLGEQVQDVAGDVPAKREEGALVAFREGEIMGR
jgi:hypothetical protein